MSTNCTTHSQNSFTPTVKSSTHSTPLKTLSGLPEQRDHAYSRDVHMDTAKGFMGSRRDIHMATAKGLTDDITMDTIRGGMTLKQGGLQMREKQLLESPEVRRKATVAQLCKWHMPLPLNTYC